MGEGGGGARAAWLCRRNSVQFALNFDFFINLLDTCSVVGSARLCIIILFSLHFCTYFSHVVHTLPHNSLVCLVHVALSLARWLSLWVCLSTQALAPNEWIAKQLSNHIKSVALCLLQFQWQSSPIAMATSDWAEIRRRLYDAYTNSAATSKRWIEIVYNVVYILLYFFILPSTFSYSIDSTGYLSFIHALFACVCLLIFLRPIGLLRSPVPPISIIIISTDI